MKYISFLLSLLLFTSTSLSAQTRISGIVLDENQEVLAGANCFLKGTYDGATSDQNGHFAFETSEVGLQTLNVSFIGYQLAEVNINLDSLQGQSRSGIADSLASPSPSSSVPSSSSPVSLPSSVPPTSSSSPGPSLSPFLLEIQLTPAFSIVKAVEITAGAFEASDEKAAVILNSLDMVTTAGASGDVYGALQTLPGTTTNGESGRLFVRGGSSDESKTYINGTLVHQAFGASAPMTPVRGRFNPFMFKGTVFSTGGFSAEYGNALSSVLLLQTNDSPIEDQLNISVLTVGADLAGTKKWKTGAITGSANYTNLQPYMALVPQTQNWQQAPLNYGSAVNLWQETSRTGVFKLYAVIDRSTLAVTQPEIGNDTMAQEVSIQNDNLFMNAAWSDLIGEKTKLETGASLTFNSQKLSQTPMPINQGLSQNSNGSGQNQSPNDPASPQATSGLNQILRGMHLKSTLTHQLVEKVILRGGLEYFDDDQANTYQNEQDALELTLQDQRMAGFVEVDLYASSKVVSRIGGRFEQNLQSGTTNAAPRASLAWKASTHSQFSLAYGWFYQEARTADRLFAPGLEPARADHYIFNYSHSRNKRHFRSEVYFKDYRNLTKYASSSAWPHQGYNDQGTGYAYGLDLFLRDKKTIKNGDYWISYSFLETKRDFEDYPGLATPIFSSRHNLSIVYKHWISDLRSLLGMTFSYGSPRVYNDPNDTQFNAAKSPAFRSLDINWSYLHRQNIIFHAAISNVPGFKNQFGRRFTPQPDANGFFASEPILQPAPRFFLLGCFITLTKNGEANQLDQIN